MTSAQSTTSRQGHARLGQLAEYLLTERAVLLAVLLVVVLVWFKVLEAGQYLVAPYDLGYLASALESLVPLCLLALAELLVIVSGRGGIDLSVGAIVSLAGMAFGFCVAAGWPVAAAMLVCLAVGALLGAVNGVLTAYLRFPPLIATLATYYAYSSLAMVSNDRAPISTPPVQRLSALTRPVDVLGLPVPLHVVTILLPCLVLVWLVVNRSTYGRKLYAVGTNDVAATFAALSVPRVRLAAYTGAGLLAGVVAVVTVAQFASARPDAGTVGNGMALPAITIAVLGGVAIQGGVGTVGGVAMAALLVTWLNAGLLLAFEGSEGSQYQLLALGVVLVGSALLNTVSLRRYGRLS